MDEILEGSGTYGVAGLIPIRVPLNVLMLILKCGQEFGSERHIWSGQV